jgi:cytochrome c peroxidase
MKMIIPFRWLVFPAGCFVFASGVLSRTGMQDLALGTPGPVPFPLNNPYSKAKADLGKMLFKDGRLSKTGATPCTWCHDPNKGYGDGRTISIGDTKEALTRHTPSLYNVGYAQHLFWDGRSSTLEEQALFPIKHPKEMAMDFGKLPEKLKKAGYEIQFEKAFGTNQITVERVAMALATFERTITHNNTPYDHWLKGDKNAMSRDSIAGFDIFKGKAHCIDCHAGPNFTLAMTKTGVAYKNTGVYQSPVLDPDPGRIAIEKANLDMKDAFKIPTLRGVGRNEPFMHNGDIATLEEVVEFYDRGGDRGKLKKLNLTDQEKKQLVEFLRNGITNQDE